MDDTDKMLADLPKRGSPYVPIGDYAVIGDTLTTALIARDGALEWLCFPNFDSPSWFGTLLDAHRGGRCFVGPPGEAETTRCYHDGTPILVTHHRTREGLLKVTDLMPLALDDTPGLRPARRVLRLIEAVEGSPEVALSIAPRPDYARHIPKLRRAGKVGWTVADGRRHMLIQSDIPLEETSPSTVTGRQRLQAGERRLLSLSYVGGGPGIVPAMGQAAWDELGRTRRWWEAMVDDIAYEGPFRHAVHRSLVTLRLLAFSQSGAVIAAPTMGLPETPGGVRNYDYRFCWLRDASFILDAFLSLGCVEEGQGFFRWLLNATRKNHSDLHCFYSIFGRTDIGMSHLQSVEGWRSSAPVQLGNAANAQLQLDAYGSVINAALVFMRHGGQMNTAEKSRLVAFARRVMQDWTLPDNGLWEMPDPRRHHTYSKVMCWSALASIVALVEADGFGVDTGPFIEQRDRIRDHVLAAAWNEDRGAFTGAFGQDWLDAAVLLMPRLGIVAADDPRMVATYELIQNELGRGPELYRYTPGVDGLPGKEGTFTVCGFWAADYLARAGRTDEAEARISALLERANDVGLMAEELDPDTGAQLGNFPQGFSHAGLIGAVMALNEARGHGKCNTEAA